MAGCDCTSGMKRVVGSAIGGSSSGYSAPGVRTTKTEPVAPPNALRLLQEGNDRFVAGKPQAIRTNAKMRTLLVEEGQAPHTAIIGCADSRAPLEKIFDALPGDIFVLRNAGNTCTHAEGSFVGSLEFATGALGSRLVLVLGHTKCGAIYGATKGFMEAKLGASSNSSALEGLLHDLGAVAEVAAAEKGEGADFETVASHAVRVNVFRTMNFLLTYSKSLREQVQSGKLQIHGGIYELETGKVKFLGPSPDQDKLVQTSASLPPSMQMQKEPVPSTVRTASDAAVQPQRALEILQNGNKRFVQGMPQAPTATQDMRKALVDKGQAPHAAIIGCADSRAPVETIFDAAPGDLFVLRNAGNTCTHAEGSFVGSLEFCVGKLGSRLIVVMGHTNCGALAGAAATYLSMKEAAETKAAGCALEGLLKGLTSVAAETAEELGVRAGNASELAASAVKVNVFNTINFLLKFSEPIRALARSGELEIHGAVYKLETGDVEFWGPSPKQEELLASQMHLPPSMSGASDAAALIGAHGVRTPTDPPMEASAALQLLKQGNERFAVGSPIAGRIDAKMRKALATVGQAPHTAVLGCADSRVPLELVFDALPGDLFVLRNAGNTCVHSEGSVMGSLEFCTGALGTKLILVLGHTKCGAINGATKDYMANKGTTREQAPNALGALLQGLNDVAQKAEAELSTGPGKPSEEDIAVHAVKVNVFNSMDFLVKNSPAIRNKVIAGEVEIQGGIYDLDSGRVRWLGKGPRS